MPFDLFIARAPGLWALRGEAPPAPGLMKRLFSKSSAQAPAQVEPISQSDFFSAVETVGGERRADDSFRLMHSEGGPWFVASWREPGHVVLSTSYGNHRYLRNFADMFDCGLALSNSLRARLFEEVGGSEVTRRNIDALLAPSGRYVALQGQTFFGAIERMGSQGQAPLEFPVGPIDLVAEYLLFQIVPSTTVSPAEIAELVAERVPQVRVEVAAPGALSLVGADDGKWLSKVLLRPDGRWQIWPSWGQAPFARIGPATVDAAEVIHQRVTGELRFMGQPWDEALRREVRSRLTGLGIDFFQWRQGTKPPAPA